MKKIFQILLFCCTSFVFDNASAQTTTAFTQSTAISIPSSGNATPFPSNVTVSGMGTCLSRVTITLTTLSHTYHDDIDIMLVTPTSQRILLMSDCGGGNSATRTYTFADEGTTTTYLADGSVSSNGTYLPTNYDGSENLGGGTPTITSLSQLIGTNPNGTWSLYINDDVGGDAGSIASWTVTVTTHTLSAANTGTAACSGTSNGTMNVTSGGIGSIRGMKIIQCKNDFLNLSEVDAIRLGTATDVAHTSYASANGNSLYSVSYPWTNLINNNNTDLTHANSGIGQFMSITFNQNENLDYVRIYNRYDCCQDRASNLLVQFFSDAGLSTLVYARYVTLPNNGNNTTSFLDIDILGFSWNDASTVFPNRTGLTGGSTYTATITGPCSASASTSRTIGTNPLPQVSAFSGNTMCAGDNNARLTVTTSAGTGPFNVVYNSGSNGSVTSGTSFLAVPQNPASTTNYTLTSVTDANGCVRNSGFTDASATVTVNPLPQGSFTGNTICGDGSGTAQLTWTATAGTNNYSVTWNTTSANYPGFPNQVTSAVVSGTPFNVPYNPVETTTYTVSSVTDGNGCTRSVGFTSNGAVVTVTPPFPTPTLTNVAITTGNGFTGYTAPPAVGNAWGLNAGHILNYTATSWPACVTYGFTLPSINAQNSTYNPLVLDVTDVTNTNLSTGKACFVGSTSYTYISSSTGNWVTTSVPVRCRIIASKPLQYIPTLKSLMLKANSNFTIQVFMEANGPSGALGASSGWQGAVKLFNDMYTPTSAPGNQIWTNLYPALTSSAATVSTTNTSFFTFNAGSITAGTNSPVCIDYPSGGVPTGGPVNATSSPGNLNTNPCSLTYLWTSSATPLINTTSANPTPIIANATGTSLTTYSYTVSSGTDRVCYGVSSASATVAANTTSPTTWLSSTTAGADNWYNHANWSNCVPCNNTSPACAKQAVIATSNNYPNISTGTAKATSVLHNATPNKITITPGATLKLINP